MKNSSLFNSFGTPLLVLFFLSGCSTSSGVLQIGPDTYTISTSNEISPAWAKKRALEDADKHCRSIGKFIMPMQERGGSHVDTFGDNIATYDFTFRCLGANDPMLSRPELKDPTLNVKIDQNVSMTSNLEKAQKNENIDLYTELQKLDQLRQQGILTEEEFQELKRSAIEKHK